MRSEAQKRARSNYMKKCKKVMIVFYPAEQDLIDHLDKKEAKQTYIKELIRKDMKKNKGEPK